MKLLKFTIIKLCFFLSIGICIAEFFPISLNASLLIFSALFLLFSITLLISKKQFQKNTFFGIITFITTLSLGVLVYNFHNQKNFKNHYSKQIVKENQTLCFRVHEKLKPNSYYNKYIIEVLTLDNQKATGKLLLNVKRDSTQNTFKIDDILITNSEFKPLHSALNPNQFNYKKYLEKKYIYHQIHTENRFVFTVSSKRHTIYGFADAIRTQINQELKNYSFKPNELAIINALLLGQRQDMSTDIYNSYTNAGAVHILAVSGLHVGLILLLITFVLKPIEFIKYGKIIKVILILVLLWSFAIIAGLSASVTRAVTMFSIVAIAMHLKRPANIYNTLAISMFVLLLFKPLFLFDVGFQMSYLAVLAIVSIQPILYKIWKPKLKAVDYFWQIFTVTIAAQFGVIPISLFYFHQFPGLFFVSNLIIIPVLGLILGFGILVIILALLHMLPDFLATFYGEIINLMNRIVFWVSEQEQFLIKDISFDLLYVIASYISIISLVQFYKKRSYVNVCFILFSILIFQASFIYNQYNNQTDEFIIFHKSRFSLITKKTSSKLKITHDFDSLTLRKDKTVRNYKIGNFIKNIKTDSIKSIYAFNNKTLLVIDSFGIYNVKSFKTDYILLRQSPRINLKRVIDSLQPKLIIADGSNYKSYIKRWETTCKKQKIPFHQTGKKGAFIMR